MKRVLSFILSLVLAFNLITPISATNSHAEPDQIILDTYSFVNTHTSEQSPDNYLYIQMVSDFFDNETAVLLYSAADILASGEVGDILPDKECYMETLLRLFAIYEHDTASIVNQSNLPDNTRTWRDWALDATDLITNCFDTLFEVSDISSELTSNILTALGILQTEAENINNFINSLTALQTQLESLSRFQSFLQSLINSDAADGELKAAARELSSCLNSAAQIKLDCINDVLDDNFENTGEHFFTDLLFDLIPKADQYKNDETLHWFVDEADNISSLLSSWQFGDSIGRFVGNVIIGGEDLNTRMKEMVTLRLISIATLDSIGDKQKSLDSFSVADADGLLMLYEMLAITNLRGEYCLTNVLISDAGLTSWFNKNSDLSSNAEKWYESQATILKNLLDHARSITHKTSNDLDIDLTEGYWENNIQSPCVYKFSNDGIVKEYFLEPGMAISDDTLFLSREMTYEFDGSTLLLHSEGWTNKLELVTKSDGYSWDLGIVHNLPDKGQFFYETGYDGGDPLSNAMYLVKSTTADLSLVSNAVSFNGHSYLLFDSNLDWHTAKSYCESQGGHLATITSKEEDEFIYSYLQKIGYTSVLFGLSDENEINNWEWVTGEPFVYSNWKSGEPNHQGGYEHYGMYYEKNSDGSWNDGSGGVCPFVCEWDYTTGNDNVSSQLNLSSLIGTWDSTDNEKRLRFDSTGLDVAYSKSGVYNADGKIEMTDKITGEERLGAFIITGLGQITLYWDLEEYLVDCSSSGDTLIFNGETYKRVDELTQDHITGIIGTWICDGGSFTFFDNGRCSVQESGKSIPESGTYSILDSSTILINEPGRSPYKVTFELNGDTLTLGKNIFTRYGKSRGDVLGTKSTICGTWRHENSVMQYSFYDTGIYEVHLIPTYSSLPGTLLEDGTFEVISSTEIYLYSDPTALPQVINYDAANDTLEIFGGEFFTRYSN